MESMDKILRVDINTNTSKKKINMIDHKINKSLKEEKFVKGAVFAIMKNTKAYDKLKASDIFQKKRNADIFIDLAGVEKTEINTNTFSEFSFVNELSSFVQTCDSSLLEFAIFCSQVGIINHPN